MVSREELDSEYVNYAVKFSDRHKLTKTSSILDNLNIQVYEVSFQNHTIKLCTLWKASNLITNVFSM